MHEMSPTVRLRVVRGDPSADELAALVAVLAARQQHTAETDAPGAGAGVDIATGVLRRTGRALPGRHPGRAPSLSRPRWRHDAVRPASASDRSSTRRRQAG